MAGRVYRCSLHESATMESLKDANVRENKTSVATYITVLALGTEELIQLIRGADGRKCKMSIFNWSMRLFLNDLESSCIIKFRTRISNIVELNCFYVLATYCCAIL